MVINSDTIAAIKDRVDIREGMEYYGIKFNQRGFAICPFHNEKSPSMIARKGVFHCFGCGEHGDIINFVEKFFSLGFREAVEKINNDFGLGLDNTRKISPEEFREQMLVNERAKELQKEEHEINRMIYGFYCNQVHDMRNVIDVLARRIDDIEKAMDMEDPYYLRVKFEAEGNDIKELRHSKKERNRKDREDVKSEKMIHGMKER